MHRSKIILIVSIVLVTVLFFALGLDRYLSLDYIKSQQGFVRDYYLNNSLKACLIYFSVYAVSTALSFPGAAILTLLGGTIFGPVVGTLVVSFASTVGATLAFLGARFLMRDWVQGKFSDRLESINRGVARDGALYLFSLRLIPVFPFFMVNLLMGLTRMPILTYFLVSQIGMLPGTFVYVYAGTELGNLDSLAGILSPSLLGAFVLLGILPYFSKIFISFLNNRKLYRKFKKPQSYDYNLVVIGAGAAGLVTSYIAAAVRAKVALIEKNEMGGDCLNTGCVPSKALIRTSRLLYEASQSKKYGIQKMETTFNFKDAMDRVRKVIEEIAPHDSVERYTGLGVECIKGTAEILTPFEVKVDGRVLTTKNIVVASGAEPFVPNIPGLSGTCFLTTDTLWRLNELPRRFLILGGGPIGCEMAQCFSRLGSSVTVIEKDSHLMPREDLDVSSVVMENFKKEGIRLVLSHEVTRFEVHGDTQRVFCRSKDPIVGGASELSVEFDVVLVALGRKARVKGFGLENLGVPLTGRGTVDVNEYLQALYPNIFIAGDVTGPYQFTHVAAHQAWYAAVNALFRPFKTYKVDYRVVPWVTYVDPEVARVGISEKEALEKGVKFEVTKYDISDLDRAIADGSQSGFVKVLTKHGSDKILGAVVVGSHSGEMITEFVTAMKRNLGLGAILQTIHAYPTLSEANKYVAGEWRRNHQPLKILKLLEKFHRYRRG